MLEKIKKLYLSEMEIKKLTKRIIFLTIEKKTILNTSVTLLKVKYILFV